MKNALFTILFLVATSGFSQNPSGTAEKANPPPIQRATRTDVEHRFGAPTFTDKEFNGICQELYGADIWTLLDLMDKEKPQVREDSRAKLTSLLTLCGSKANDLEAQYQWIEKRYFVTSIAAGSPAEKLALKPGDELIAVISRPPCY